MAPVRSIKCINLPPSKLPRILVSLGKMISVISDCVSATVRVLSTGVEVANLDAGLLGGGVHVAGSLLKPANDQDKPHYTFEGDFEKINVTSLGGLLGLHWAGDPLDGNGKVELSGYTAKDLATSASGSLHFECRRGAIGNQPSRSAKHAESSEAEGVPASLGRFDKWTVDATIGNDGLTLDASQVIAGAHKQSVTAAVQFGDPPVVSFPAPKQVAAAPKLAAGKH